jgi:polyisoprenoid-binding protein YceI
MATTNWALDLNHSEVQFKIKHLMITNVTGSFTNFDVTASTEEDDFTNATISLKANVDSISTNNEKRDGHLKSADFFDAEQFPLISFVSTNSEATDDKAVFNVVGNLTIKGVTKSIKLNVEFAGVTKDPYGQTKAGFTITGKINRTDFGLSWNAALETGGVMVSEEVKISAEIQMIKQ